MKKIIIILLLTFLAVLLTAGFLFRNRIKLLYTSLHAFKEENLARSFQHMAQLQPTKKVTASGPVFQFARNEVSLPDSFQFKDRRYSTAGFLEQTKTTGLLVIKDDVIRHEAYFLGADEATLFSSNSMCKSFVSALMGIAVDEGSVRSTDEPIGDYIPELAGTKLADIPIKACLTMTSGLKFDEERDLSGFSVKTMLGIPWMRQISRLNLETAPFSRRRYLSINTEILGAVLSNAAGTGLADYMQEKLWSKIGAESDAYWTLNNGRELAMGGLNVTLRDYARFGRLYLNGGAVNEEQVVPARWVKESLDVSASYSRPGANDDPENALGYGYQWWVPKGCEGEFMAIGVYSQWIYVNPSQCVIIVKTSADPSFTEAGYEEKHVELFRALAKQAGDRL